MYARTKVREKKVNYSWNFVFIARFMNGTEVQSLDLTALLPVEYKYCGLAVMVIASGAT